MKNQYVADINDFRKYGLIRALLSRNSLRCGVFWMLTDRDASNDGEIVQYLGDKKNEALDPELFQKLWHLVHTFKDRTVVRIQQEIILPRAKYFEDLVPDVTALRSDFFYNGLRHLASSDLIFFDPDNGLEVKSKRRGNKNSCKYLYLDEVESSFQRGHSLLIYQHFPRIARVEYIQGRINQLRDRLGNATIYSFTTDYVCFFLIVQAIHHSNLQGGIEQVDTQWGSHFTVKAH